MNRILPVAVLILSVIATSAGCKRDADVAVAPPATPTLADKTSTAPATTTDVISEVNYASPASEAPGFDAKAFAGSYGGTLPCADCPGIDTTVSFSPEGTYALAETWLERNQSITTEGTWSVKDDGRTLLLDPTEKDGQDRWFQIASRSEIRALDTQGKPITSALDYSLRRK